MKTLPPGINRIAEESWQHLQKELGISYPMPRWFPAEEDPEFDADPYTTAACKTTWEYNHHTKLLKLNLGPMILAQEQPTNAIQRAVIDHEHSHYISIRSDHLYSLSMSILRDEKLLKAINYEPIMTSVSNIQATREIDETMAWIAPIKLNNERSVEDVFDLWANKYDLSSEVQKKSYQDTKRKFYWASKLAERHDIKCILNPISLVNKRHPLIEDFPDASGCIADILNVYKLLKQEKTELIIRNDFQA